MERLVVTTDLGVVVAREGQYAHSNTESKDTNSSSATPSVAPSPPLTPQSQTTTSGSDASSYKTTISERKPNCHDQDICCVHKGTREEKIFEMFTSYAMQISSEDPLYIRSANVIKLLQHCNIIAEGSAPSTNSTRSSPPSQDQQENGSKSIDTVAQSIRVRDVEIIASSLLQREHSKKLNYNVFFQIMWELATLAYPNMASDTGFKLLIDTCLRYRQQKPQSRQCVFQEWKETEKLFQAFEPALQQLFSHYVDLTKKSLSGKSIDYVSYKETLRFVRKYGIISPSAISTTEFVQIYIDSLLKFPNSATERQLIFQSFKMLLLRVSLKLYSQSSASTETKLKALFQHMWLNCVQAKSADMSRARLKMPGENSSNAMKFEGSYWFASQFMKTWKKDRCIDYNNLLVPSKSQTTLFPIQQNSKNAKSRTKHINKILLERVDLIPIVPDTDKRIET